MSVIKKALVSAFAVVCMSSVFAADAPAPSTDKAAADAAAPAPRAAKRARANWYNTPGWKLMTAQERADYRAKMKGMKTPEECQAFVDQHQADMVERAKAKGSEVIPERNDACNWLKKKK